MPVQSPSVSTTKNRPVPVDPDGIVVSPDATTMELLTAILLELKAMRLMLAAALNMDVRPEDLRDS